MMGVAMNIMNRLLLVLLLAQCTSAFAQVVGSIPSLLELEGRAKGGSSQAQFQLALALERDPDWRVRARAIDWYLAAAKQGNPGAQCAFAVLSLFPSRELRSKSSTIEFLHFAKIDERKMEAAVGLLEKAAKAGVDEALYCIGAIYSDGIGVTPDPGKGAKWFAGLRSKAEAGEPEAQFYLGMAMINSDLFPSRGPAEGRLEGRAWLLKAAASGFAEAQMAYSSAIDVEDERIRWLGAAAEQGLPQAQWALGNFFLFGNGPKRNPDEAIRWYKKAAAQGYGPAAGAMAGCFLKGIGVPVDPAIAESWKAKAEEQADTLIAPSLGGSGRKAKPPSQQ
jgi:hypothetical protein